MIRALNIIALVLATIGAFLLVRFPPVRTMWTADGGTQNSFRWNRASAVAIGFFLAGFIVQLIAIILAE
jgi:hypothetical protein